MTRWFNAYVQAQPRRAGVIFGLAAGLLLLVVTLVATGEVVSSVRNGILTAIISGLVLYSVGTWDRGW